MPVYIQKHLILQTVKGATSQISLEHQRFYLAYQVSLQFVKNHRSSLLHKHFDTDLPGKPVLTATYSLKQDTDFFFSVPYNHHMAVFHPQYSQKIKILHLPPPPFLASSPKLYVTVCIFFTLEVPALLDSTCSGNTDFCHSTYPVSSKLTGKV